MPSFSREWAAQQALNDSIPNLSTPAKISAVLDKFGTTPGSMLRRGATLWGIVDPLTLFDQLGAAAAIGALRTSATVFGLAKVDGTTITALGGVISAVGGGSSSSAASIQDDGTTVQIALSDGAGQLILDGAGNPVFVPEVFPASAIPAPTAATLGGVKSIAAVAHNFLTTISTTGAPAQARPAAADLSDYVEGTWAPVLNFTVSSAGITYSAVGGSYTRIGNRVFFQCDISLSSKGAASGLAFISGLPITSNADPNGHVAVTAWITNVAAGLTPLFFIGPSSTLVGLDKLVAGGTASNLTDADFTNTTEIMLMGHYRV